jgi:hypothetical protein
MDAAERLASLHEERRRAVTRVNDLEADWRSAVEASWVASAALTELERNGAGAPAISKAEKELARARELATQPWAERIDGARRSLRDSDQAIRAHTAANLPELVMEVEERGQQVADRINQAASNLVAEYAELEHLAAELGRLLTSVTPPGPMDVTRPESEPLARAATALIGAGGELGPRVSRLNAPWDRLDARPGSFRRQVGVGDGRREKPKP